MYAESSITSVSGDIQVAGTPEIAVPGALYAVDFSSPRSHAELLPPFGCETAPWGRALTKTEENETIIINRSDRSTYPDQKSVLRSGATPDVARSAAFYDAVLGALGMRRVMQLPENEGTNGIAYGVDYPVFWIDRFHPHGVKQHMAFAASSRAQVDAFYAAALRAGGADNGKPGFRDTAKGFPRGYYAAFALDPDGNNMEAVFRER
jgi:catechol 2,3-dioxygenase-like lactoylglutathione lyase family enzyme